MAAHKFPALSLAQRLWMKVIAVALLFKGWWGG